MHFSDSLESYRNDFGFAVVDRGIRREGKAGGEDWLFEVVSVKNNQTGF